MNKKYIIISVILVCLLGLFIGSWLTKDFLNNGFNHDTKAKKVNRTVLVGTISNYHNIKSI